MLSQLYAMKPSADPAFARSSVSATMTWLMQAAASLLSGGGLAIPGLCTIGRNLTPVNPPLVAGSVEVAPPIRAVGVPAGYV